MEYLFFRLICNGNPKAHIVAWCEQLKLAVLINCPMFVSFRDRSWKSKQGPDPGKRTTPDPDPDPDPSRVRKTNPGPGREKDLSPGVVIDPDPDQDPGEETDRGPEDGTDPDPNLETGTQTVLTEDIMLGNC